MLIGRDNPFSTQLQSTPKRTQNLGQVFASLHSSFDEATKLPIKAGTLKATICTPETSLAPLKGSLPIWKQLQTSLC